MTIYIRLTAESIVNHEYISFLNNFVSSGMNNDLLMFALFSIFSSLTPPQTFWHDDDIPPYRNPSGNLPVGPPDPHSPPREVYPPGQEDL